MSNKENKKDISGDPTSVPMVRGFRSMNNAESRRQDLTEQYSAEQIEQRRRNFVANERKRIIGNEIENSAASQTSDNDFVEDEQSIIRQEQLRSSEFSSNQESAATDKKDKNTKQFAETRKVSAAEIAKDENENKARRALAFVLSKSGLAYGSFGGIGRKAMKKIPVAGLITGLVDRAVLGENDGKGHAIRPAINRQNELEESARKNGPGAASEAERKDAAKRHARQVLSASSLAPQSRSKNGKKDKKSDKKKNDKNAKSNKKSSGKTGGRSGSNSDAEGNSSKKKILGRASKELLVAVAVLAAIILFSVFSLNGITEQAGTASQEQGGLAGALGAQISDEQRLQEDAAAVYNSKCYASDTVQSDSALQATGGSVFTAGESDPVESVAGLEQTQIMHFQETVAVGKEMGISEDGIKIGLMVEKAETNGWNFANDGKSANGALKPDQPGDVIATSQDSPFSDGLPSDHGLGHGGDHGSMGIMQQQFPWWGDGTVDSLMNPRSAARWFFEKLKDTDYKSMSPGLAAQSVQRSFDASGSNYTAHQAEVDELYKKIGNTPAGYNWDRYKGSGKDPKPGGGIDNKSYSTDMVADQARGSEDSTLILAQGSTDDSSVDGSKVLIIGDSLTVRAEKEIKSAMSGVKINAEVGRTYQQGNEQLSGSAKSDMESSDVVIMMLGTNGTFTKSDIDETKRIIGGKKLVLMTVGGDKVPSASDVNNIVKSSGEKYIDWAGQVERDPSLISDDSIHETIGEGTEKFASTIAKNFGGGSASAKLEKSEMFDEKSLETNAVRGGRIVAKRWPDGVDAVLGLRPGDSGDHGKGRANDVMLKDYKGEGEKVGDEISDFFIKNADELNVEYVIFKQRIYQPSAGNEWQPMEDRGSDNENHFNHVHISYKASEKYSEQELKDIAAEGGVSSGLEPNDETASGSDLSSGSSSSGDCGSLQNAQKAGTPDGGDIIIRDDSTGSDDTKKEE